jgi:hypothetical protein
MGTPSESFPFPSMLVSKHIPSAEKRPFAAYAKVVRASQRFNETRVTRRVRGGSRSGIRFVRGKEFSEEPWSDVSHFPGEVPLTPPAPPNERALRDEEALMTKASNNEERSASLPKRLLIVCVLAALVVAGCSADEKQAGGAKPVARVAAEAGETREVSVELGERG